LSTGLSFLSSLGISADRVWEPGDAPTVLWREHDTAVTLQRSLLPRAIPEVAGLQIAYRYQPANRSAEAGGDWFDVIPLQDGQVALVIGRRHRPQHPRHGDHGPAPDGHCCPVSHRPHAAGHYAPAQPPARQLRLGGRSNVPVRPYDPRTRRARFTSAGYPPPAVRYPDGRAEFIDVPQGTILGFLLIHGVRHRGAAPLAVTPPKWL
jgi:hypothetical protein